MATTTRKKSERVTKQAAQAEIETPKEKEFLDADHLRYLETISRDVENAKLSMAVEEQALVNLELNFKLLQVTIEKQKSLVASKAQKYETAKLKYTNYKRDIWPLYGLKENEAMGYDPISGKIVKQ